MCKEKRIMTLNIRYDTIPDVLTLHQLLMSAASLGKSELCIKINIKDNVGKKDWKRDPAVENLRSMLHGKKTQARKVARRTTVDERVENEYNNLRRHSMRQLYKKTQLVRHFLRRRAADK